MSRITPPREVTTWSLAANDLLDKLSANRWIPPVVNVCAFALMIYGLGQGAWRLKAPTALPASSPPIVKTDSSADLQLLLSAQLFGHATGTASAETSPVQIPLSGLNLVLTGVLARATSSVALLSINGAPEAPVAAIQRRKIQRPRISVSRRDEVAKREQRCPHVQHRAHPGF